MEHSFLKLTSVLSLSVSLVTSPALFLNSPLFFLHFYFSGWGSNCFFRQTFNSLSVLSLLFTFLSDVSTVPISCLWVVLREILAFSIGWLA